jgi:hypothetical protein
VKTEDFSVCCAYSDNWSVIQWDCYNFLSSTSPSYVGSSLLYWSKGLIAQSPDLSQAVGLFGRVISSSQGIYLNTGQHKHRKTRTPIKHPWAGFEPAVTASERPKIVHTLDRSPNVTGIVPITVLKSVTKKRIVKTKDFYVSCGTNDIIDQRWSRCRGPDEAPTVIFGVCASVDCGGDP